MKKNIGWQLQTLQNSFRIYFSFIPFIENNDDVDESIDIYISTLSYLIAIDLKKNNKKKIKLFRQCCLVLFLRIYSGCSKILKDKTK